MEAYIAITTKIMNDRGVKEGIRIEDVNEEIERLPEKELDKLLEEYANKMVQKHIDEEIEKNFTKIKKDVVDIIAYYEKKVAKDSKKVAEAGEGGKEVAKNENTNKENAKVNDGGKNAESQDGKAVSKEKSAGKTDPMDTPRPDTENPDDSDPTASMEGNEKDIVV